MIQIHTGERIKTILKERGLRQADIVKSAENFTHLGKLSKMDLSNYVKGITKPSQTKIHLLARVLNVSEAWLMGLDAPRERERKEPEVLTLYNKLDESRKIQVIEEIKYKLDEQKEERGLKLVPDPNWKAELTAKDREIIKRKVKEVKEEFASDDLAIAMMDGRDLFKFEDEDDTLLNESLEKVFEHTALKKKQKYTPNIHRTKKEDE